LKKIKAAYYFIIYTIGGSIVLLIGILALYNEYNTTFLNKLIIADMPVNLEYLLFLGFFLSFSAKIPLVPFHI